LDATGFLGLLLENAERLKFVELLLLDDKLLLGNEGCIEGEGFAVGHRPHAAVVVDLPISEWAGVCEVCG
jgi:hypothetical protein